jgi:hypothetical protein
MVAENIWVVYDDGLSGPFFGTSASTPLWAGFMALVNQQATANGQPTVGFINPAIYAIGKGASYTACFHDITTGNNETLDSLYLFPAVPGYDLCTGWGTPAGSSLIDALAPLPQPDLTKDSDHLDNLNPSAGATITASITITNQSCPSGGAAAGAFHVGFYWSTDSSFSGVSPFYKAPVSGCADGGSVSITQAVTVAQSTTPGTYYLGYKIDDLNEVAECDEDNNGIFYWAVTVSPPCPVTVSPTSITFPAKGGSKTVQVKALGTDCAWTAVSNDPFIIITQGTSGTGNGIVHFAILGNTNTVPVNGTMIIAGQTVSVDQYAGGCTYSLNPKSGKFKAAGGFATVKVKANLSDCAWTAVSNDPFITITSDSSGVGNNIVGYTVAANTNTTARSGTISIGGQTFVITQAGQR